MLKALAKYNNNIQKLKLYYIYILHCHYTLSIGKNYFFIIHFPHSYLLYLSVGLQNLFLREYMTKESPIC